MHYQALVFKKFKNGFLLFLFLLSLCAKLEAAMPWQTLADGINYLDLAQDKQNPWSHLHVFKVDPSKITFELLLASDLQRKAASVEEWSHSGPFALIINGGFFDKNYHPLGLRVRKTTVENPFKNISWWGIFAVQNDHPSILAAKEYNRFSKPELAIQAGPRLLIDGTIPSLKPGLAQRTALCVTKSNKIIILVSEHAALSTEELAKMLQKTPLSCWNALNLDGGSSTQLFAKIGSFSVHVPGISVVSDAIALRLKPTS